METFSTLLTLCAGNSPVTGEFSAQRSVTRSFDDFFDLRLNKRFSKQSWGWWFETPSRCLLRHCNDQYHHDNNPSVYLFQLQHTGRVETTHVWMMAPARSPVQISIVLVRKTGSETTAVSGDTCNRVWWLYRSTLGEWYKQLVLPIDH